MLAHIEAVAKTFGLADKGGIVHTINTKINMVFIVVSWVLHKYPLQFPG